MVKKALISGITGQDGSFLAEFLLAKGYQVHGIVRRASTFNTERLDSIYADPHEQGAQLFLHYGDVTDGSGLRHVIEKVQPDEIYNLAGAIARAGEFRSARVHGRRGRHRNACGCSKRCAITSEQRASQMRFYQAGSSEMFGAAAPPQNEATPFYPRSPYAVSKVAAHWYAVNYREAYGLFISNGILFNHESRAAGRNVRHAQNHARAGRIKLGLQKKLFLGNLDARRDWGYAGDYVEAMWLMLQQPEPDDYVVATGESHSVREFLDAGRGPVRAGLEEVSWRPIRATCGPRKSTILMGDASKIARKLGWKPKVSFEELVRLMVDHDLELARQEQTLAKAGHKVVRARSLAWVT